MVHNEVDFDNHKVELCSSKVDFDNLTFIISTISVINS